MKATEKMDAFGMKALAERIRALRSGTALETVYRWRQALNRGQGISDARKSLLIEATAASDHPISWADFAPDLVNGSDDAAPSEQALDQSFAQASRALGARATTQEVHEHLRAPAGHDDKAGSRP